jgi:hypothetical protein
VLNDLSGPVPNYRFQTLIAKALEICSELKSLGSALLSAKEKKDNEHLSTLRAFHETAVATFSLDMKNRALDEASAVLAQLLQNREGPAYRLQFYKGLVGLTDGPPGDRRLQRDPRPIARRAQKNVHWCYHLWRTYRARLHQIN